MVRVPVIDMTATGINITRMRIRAGLTVRDIQDIFGFSTPQAIYKWQRGTAMPTVDNLAVLAAVLGVKIDDILVFQDSRQFRIPAYKSIKPAQRIGSAWSLRLTGKVTAFSMRQCRVRIPQGSPFSGLV